MQPSEEFKRELINSLPSKRLLEVVSNLAVRHPRTHELIFLKQRPTYEDTPLSEYIEYKEKHDPFHDYRELIAKHVIVDISLLGTRGRALLNRETFKEWLKRNSKCKCCGTQLPTDIINFSRDIHKLVDVDGERERGMYCTDCYEGVLQKLMDSRLVEEFKENKIYCKDGKYFVYWRCPYYFETLEDCRVRIDNAHVAIIPRDVFALIGTI